MGLGVGLLACAAAFVRAQEARVPDTQRLQQMAARFAPTEISADVSKLSDADRRVLAKLVEAAKIVDGLFLRQAWAGNDAMLADLARDTSSEGRARLHYFLINKGPWSRLDHDAPFVPGAPPKPAGANYYPEGATKAELEHWIQSLPEAERARATGFFTVIRRAGNAFTLVPYSVEYQGELARAAGFLREAAQLAKEPTLKAFLTKRADAFLSNDYYESDVAWMELDGAIEPTIGPYEVYEDELFNYKAGFEASVTIQDPGETAKPQRLAAELQDIENHLPIDPTLRNPGSARSRRSPSSTRSMRRATATARDGGVQPAERRACHPREGRETRDAEERAGREVRQDAAADLEDRPAGGGAGRSPSTPSSPTSSCTELMHGLGPHSITTNGRKTTVRQELKETTARSRRRRPTSGAVRDPARSTRA
jgi:hypothetical protein